MLWTPTYFFKKCGQLHCNQLPALIVTLSLYPFRYLGWALLFTSYTKHFLMGETWFRYSCPKKNSTLTPTHISGPHGFFTNSDRPLAEDLSRHSAFSSIDSMVRPQDKPHFKHWEALSKGQRGDARVEASLGLWGSMYEIQ